MQHLPSMQIIIMGFVMLLVGLEGAGGAHAQSPPVQPSYATQVK